MKRHVTVYKLDERGREVWSYPAEVVRQEDGAVQLEAFFNRDDVDMGFATFARGDRFVEFFYNDRWYNVFAVYDGREGALKGWYCNICRPAQFRSDAIRCEDLALDVWITPEGEVTVLDEDEFAELELADGELAQALAGLREVKRLAEAGDLPL